MDQQTVKQHFVPKFYLKRFGDDKGFIEVLDIRNRTLIKPRTYAGVCYDKYFYALETGVPDDASQEFERMFTQLEDLTSKRWDIILENAKNKKLILDDFDELSWFLSMQWMRTPGFREQLHKMKEDVTQQMMKFRVNTGDFEISYKKIAAEHGRELSNEDVDNVKKSILDGKYKLKFNNAGHLNFIPRSLEGFRNLFFNKQWNIYLAPGNCQFITTDNPVAEWQPKIKSFYGNTFLERKHYLSLSPKILIELIYPTRDSLKVGPHETVKYKYIPRDDVQMYNILLADHGFKFAYAQRNKEFNDMIKQLKKPNRASVLYNKNYFDK